MRMAEVVAVCWGEASELGSARAGAGTCMNLGCAAGRAPRRGQDLPARCEDSTAAAGIRLADWPWGVVFRGPGVHRDMWPPVRTVVALQCKPVANPVRFTYSVRGSIVMPQFTRASTGPAR